MGLLDALFSSGGGGGLLSGLNLNYPSPLYQQQQDQPQTQYDPMGSAIYTPQPTAPSPFGQLPGFNAADYAPKSAFTSGAAPAAFVGAPATTSSPQPANQSPAPSVASAQPQVNDIGVGGYQMPRFGSVADYTPQAVSTDISAQSRQQPQQQQRPANLPSTLVEPSGGFGGALRGFADNAHTGPLGALIGGIGGALGAQSPERQTARAQYQNYIANGLSPEQAFLAVSNPKAGEIAAQRLLEKKQYSFTKLDNDTVVNQDPQTGKVSVAYGGDTKQGSLAGPDGKPIAIPEGLDAAGRKTFVNEIAKINADAATGKKTGEQATAEIYANKMELSNKTLGDLANQGTSLSGKITSGLPLGNYLQSPEYQKYKQASSNFITALLRKESGAAIGKSEFDRYDKEYMPQPGDGPEVLAQKTEARRVAIEGMKKGAGPGYKPPTASPLPAGWSVSVR